MTKVFLGTSQKNDTTLQKVGYGNEEKYSKNNYRMLQGRERQHAYTPTDEFGT
jgi:hypothetical protein